jgi:hypothetical protein
VNALSPLEKFRQNTFGSEILLPCALYKVGQTDVLAGTTQLMTYGVTQPRLTPWDRSLGSFGSIDLGFPVVLACANHVQSRWQPDTETTRLLIDFWAVFQDDQRRFERVLFFGY